MPNASMERMVKNLDRRVTGVEQILPTLATKKDLDAAVARLATKEELQSAVALLATKEELRAAIAPLATKEELRVGLEETRQFTRVLFESLQDSIRLLAEGLAYLTNEVREMKSYVMTRFEDHEIRILALERGAAGRRRTSK